MRKVKQITEKKKSICFLITLLSIVWIGCDSSLDHPVFPAEKLHKIEPFDPEPYKSPQQPAEPNILERTKEPAQRSGSIFPKPGSWPLK